MRRICYRSVSIPCALFNLGSFIFQLGFSKILDFSDIFHGFWIFHFFGIRTFLKKLFVQMSVIIMHGFRIGITKCWFDQPNSSLSFLFFSSSKFPILEKEVGYRNSSFIYIVAQSAHACQFSSRQNHHHYICVCFLLYWSQSIPYD